MTKKDYQLIAGVLNKSNMLTISGISLPALTAIVNEFVAVLERENVLFSREKFLKACGF